MYEYTVEKGIVQEREGREGGRERERERGGGGWICFNDTLVQ